jgi:predicted GIY-YIG superfamily endonuclease
MDERHPGWVYVLRLQGDRRYVGWSADPETRVASHFLGRGAHWTQIHPPVAVESIQPGDKTLENVITVAMMAKHHWRNVRGGPFREVNMPCAPQPILKAYALNSPTPAPAPVEAQEVRGHSVIVEHVSEKREWRARVSGSKAAKECPVKGFKTFSGASEAGVLEDVSTWLGES